MITKLNNISTITVGHLFRKGIEPDTNGKFSVIQMKDVDSSCRLIASDLVRVNLDSPPRPEIIINQGDILFKSRGQKNTASLVDVPLENTVAASQFLVIRPEQSVLPEYLAWYLNQAPAQQYFLQRAAGTSTPHLNKESLADLEVVVPEMQVQKNITRLVEMGLQESKLVEALHQKRQLLLQKILVCYLNQNK